MTYSIRTNEKTTEYNQGIQGKPKVFWAKKHYFFNIRN